LEQLRKERWLVDVRPPFGAPQHVLRYLGRYTHRRPMRVAQRSTAAELSVSRDLDFLMTIGSITDQGLAFGTPAMRIFNV
jgi:hypothetical protein